VNPNEPLLAVIRFSQPAKYQVHGPLIWNEYAPDTSTVRHAAIAVGVPDAGLDVVADDVNA
jgi:hypothetical protein